MTAVAVDRAGGAADGDRGLRTYPAVFQATARRVPGRVALRTPGDRVRLTWTQYAQAVERAAGALAGLGVRRGDRVALLSRKVAAALQPVCNTPRRLSRRTGIDKAYQRYHALARTGVLLVSEVPQYPIQPAA